MKKILKNILPEISLITVISVYLLVSFFWNKPALVAELDSLNSKFGLTSVQPIGNDGDKLADSLFHPDVLSASIIKISRPQKDMILQLKDADTSDLSNIFLIRFRTEFSIEEIASAYSALDLVKFAEPDYALSTESINSDSPALNQIPAQVSLSDKSNNSVNVALIDSGVDSGHKDLAGRILKGWDFLDNDNIPQDEYGHGTHLAGIITKNPQASIIPIRMTDGKSGKLSNLIKSIKFAADNNADIINLSLGLPNKSGILKEAIDYAVKKNITVVAAAGNYNTDKEYYPAAYPNVISVGALDKNGDKLFLSDYGKWVDYSVVAQDVYSTLPGNKYGYKTGTSQAAAILTAKIASLIGKNQISDSLSLESQLQDISSVIKKGDYAGLLGRKF